MYYIIYEIQSTRFPFFSLLPPLPKRARFLCNLHLIRVSLRAQKLGKVNGNWTITRLPVPERSDGGQGSALLS